MGYYLMLLYVQYHHHLFLIINEKLFFVKIYVTILLIFLFFFFYIFLKVSVAILSIRASSSNFSLFFLEYPFPFSLLLLEYILSLYQIFAYPLIHSLFFSHYSFLGDLIAVILFIIILFEFSANTDFLLKILGKSIYFPPSKTHLTSETTL